MGNSDIQQSLSKLQRKGLAKGNEAGFTMIETIIVVIVIGILAAIATPSFLSWVRNKEVDDALAQVVGALKESQSEALRKGKGCVVLVRNQEILATTLPPATTESCLSTGRRNFAESSHDLQIFTNFSNDPNPPTGLDDRRLIFTHKKTTPNAGLVVLGKPDASKQRCVVVSEGVGLIRTGYYQGDPSTTLNDNNCQRDP